MTPGSTAPGADDELVRALGAAILGPTIATTDTTDVSVVVDAEEGLAIVVRAAEAEAISRDLLRQAVEAARAGGHSWAAIGGALGMSRQAAQQRFGSGDPDTPDGDEMRWLGPVTAFDEMRELEIAGRLGWHTVEAGLLRHRMVRTPTQWEHRRVLWTGPVSRMEKDGWQVGCRAFPWLYLIRDRGVPAER